MKKIPKSVWVLLGLVTVVYTSCSIIYPSGTWRYKMTVVVETPEGIKTGSAVREVYAFCVPPEIFLLESSGCEASVKKGEAVVVGLGQRGILFLLVDGDYGHQILFDTFPPPDAAGPLTPDGIRYYRSLKVGKFLLEPRQYPNFVRFRDRNDPKTIENIRRVDMNREAIHKSDPRRPIIDFEEAFGAGVNVKEVTIAITSDSVTRGIEKYLPWVLTIGGGYLSGKHIDGPEWYERLSKWEFKKE